MQCLWREACWQEAAGKDGAGRQVREVAGARPRPCGYEVSGTVAACPRARRRAVPVVEEAVRRPTEAGLAER